MHRWIAIAVALSLGGCASLLPRRAEVPAGPRELDAASPAERADYLRRAHVWRAVPTASLDLLAGPPGDDAFAFEEAVACDYVQRASLGGKTPKFYCAVAPGDDVKVKFGSDNGEVYAEVAATRLFWA